MERQGIEIDYCPTCRGVWLDRGELDKLIASGQSQQTQGYTRQDSRDHNRSIPGRDSGYNRKKKKESFLGDLFDF